VIGIPTVPRRNGTDYLTRTLASLLEELPLDPTDVLFRRVKVIVMNNRPGNHSAWSKVAPSHRLLLCIISATPPPPNSPNHHHLHGCFVNVPSRSRRTLLSPHPPLPGVFRRNLYSLCCICRCRQQVCYWIASSWARGGGRRGAGRDCFRLLSSLGCCIGWHPACTSGLNSAAGTLQTENAYIPKLDVQVRTLVENTTDVSEDPFARKAKLYLQFVENPGNVADPAPDAKDPDDNKNPKNIPGR